MSVVIVALPTQDDRVHQISSEKVPHLTLLYLGEEVDNLQQVVQYVQHVAQTSLHRFGLSVDRRGVLGDDQADVLFFEHPGWQTKELTMVRSYLLTDPNIRKAYDSVQQYPKWTPHLTLGYPESPAHPDDRDYPGISWVSFDRIAVWTGDFEGPEFTLPVHSDADGEIAMHNAKLVGASFMEEMFGGHKLHHASDDEENRFIHALLGLEVDPNSESMFHFELDEDGDVVIHYGVKGMKWGVQKAYQTQDKAAAARAAGKTKKADKLDKKAQKQFDSSDRRWETAIYNTAGPVRVHNNVANRVNEGIEKMNNSPKYKGKNLYDDPQLEKDYYSDYEKLVERSYSKAVEEIHGMSPTGKKAAIYRPATENLPARIDVVDASRLKELGHSEEETEPDLTFMLRLAKTGHVLEMNKAAAEVMHAFDDDGDYLIHEVFELEDGYVLIHYGVKGMRWGVRNDKSGAQTDPSAVEVVQKKPGTYVKAKGGKALPASEEAKRAAELKQKAKASTTDSLSNKELQELVQRMNLEKQYRQAMFDDDRRSIGKKFIDGLLGQKRYGGEKRKFTDDWEELGDAFRTKPEPEETKKK